MGKGDTTKKVFGIIGNVIIWIIAIFAIFAVFVTLLSKKDGEGAATVFGYQLRFVETGSMEKSEYTDVSGYKIKSIPARSCVFVRVAPMDEAKKAEWYADLKVGDVLTFKYVRHAGCDHPPYRRNRTAGKRRLQNLAAGRQQVESGRGGNAGYLHRRRDEL